MKKVLAGLVLALLVAAPVSAAKPAPTGELSIISIDPQFGGEVVFGAAVTNVNGRDYPMVLLDCYQGPTLVYRELGVPVFDNPPKWLSEPTTFLLGGGSSLWHQSPGPAECIATLYVYPGPSAELDEIAFAASG